MGKVAQASGQGLNCGSWWRHMPSARVPLRSSPLLTFALGPCPGHAMSGLLGSVLSAVSL